MNQDDEDKSFVVVKEKKIGRMISDSKVKNSPTPTQRRSSTQSASTITRPNFEFNSVKTRPQSMKIKQSAVVKAPIKPHLPPKRNPDTTINQNSNSRIKKSPQRRASEGNKQQNINQDFNKKPYPRPLNRSFAEVQLPVFPVRTTTAS